MAPSGKRVWQGLAIVLLVAPCCSGCSATNHETPTTKTPAATTLIPKPTTKTPAATTLIPKPTTKTPAATTLIPKPTTKTPTATTPTSVSNNGSALTFPLKTSPVAAYPKYTEVFGIAVFGHSSISDAKFQHVASVLAEWLDNDEDGCADIPLVVSKMTTTSPKPFTWAERNEGEGVLTDSEAQVDAFISAGFEPSSVTFNNELLPSCAGEAATDDCADATLEEVLHMITDKGYMPAFPSTFSTEVNSNSLLTAAMDVARGGKFTTIPNPYPTSAWYTYNDRTCNYRCMATEYVYWGISAYVGSLAGRKSSIANEWKFSTRSELLVGDVKLSAILQDTSSYRAPTVAPNGKYRAPTKCANGGVASGGIVA